MNTEQPPDILSAILAEMRDLADHRAADAGGERPAIELLRSYADRIEAAAERERIELREDEAKMLLREYAAAPDESLTPSALELKRELLRLAPAPGNAAALRESLENVERVARFCAETPRHTPGYPTDAARADVLYSRIVELGRVARAALAAPARNCDVGTADDLHAATPSARSRAISPRSTRPSSPSPPRKRKSPCSPPSATYSTPSSMPARSLKIENQSG